MTHLLRIHIGPVQEFIAAARRSRDLWFGSWLLSEHSKAAALAIADAEPAGIDALIFPAPAGRDDLEPNSPYAIANEIAALIEGNPSNIAETAKEAIDTRLMELSLSAIPENLRGRLAVWDTAQKQLKDFVEFYWVAVPVSGGQFAAAREKADSLLAARKGTRTFNPVGWGSNRPKSSLDGTRESVIPEADSGNTDRMYRHYRARRGEQLSGVDLLKRLGKIGDEDRFPSTSHMAALPLHAKLGEAAGKRAAIDAWNTYLAHLPQRMKDQEKIGHELRLPILDEYDGSLLFESRLAEHIEDREERRQAAGRLKNILEAIDIDGPVPNYYAVLVGDGDSMGRTIQTLADAGANRSFSHTLSAFAGLSRAIVRDHSGAVVFAGGDDVLAFLPLHRAVPCARELADTFAQHMSPYRSAGHSPTFSAGIAIVHHLEPLEDALELARKAERAAKDIRDGLKNALAVALDKRSGVPRMVVGHWGALDVRLRNLAALHRDGMIPDRLAYQLLDSYHLLGGDVAVPGNPALSDILALEAERIIERKRVSGGQAQVAGAHRGYLRDVLARGNTTVPALADEMVIAALLAEATTLANEPLTFSTQEAPTS